MSSYYYDPKISRSEKEEQDADVRGKIEQVRVTHPRTGTEPYCITFDAVVLMLVSTDFDRL